MPTSVGCILIDSCTVMIVLMQLGLTLFLSVKLSLGGSNCIDLSGCSFSFPDLEITVPIRHSHNTLGKPECGIYEYTPRKNLFPPKKELKRGDWKTESTSSTTSKQALSVTFPTGKLDGTHFPSLTLESTQGTGLLFLNPSTDNAAPNLACLRPAVLKTVKASPGVHQVVWASFVCISAGGEPES